MINWKKKEERLNTTEAKSLMTALRGLAGLNHAKFLESTKTKRSGISFAQQKIVNGVVFQTFSLSKQCEKLEETEFFKPKFSIFTNIHITYIPLISRVSTCRVRRCMQMHTIARQFSGKCFVTR